MNRLITILFLTLALAVNAATYPASSTSRADVQAAIALATPGNGDIITIPSGSSTWSSSVYAVGVSIIGAGTNDTKITLSGGITGIEGTNISVGFMNFALSTGSANAIRVDGYDNMFYSNLVTSSVFAQAVEVLGRDELNHPNGVAFGNVMFNTRFLVDMQGLASMNGSTEHHMFTNAIPIGTTNQFFFEDNILEFDLFANAIDSNYGGSYCFRFNTVGSRATEAHSIQSYSTRGGRTWEIYKNIFIITNGEAWNFSHYLRAGTGVSYSNEVDSSYSNPDGFINNVRSSEHRHTIGYADGSSPWDGNQALSNGSGTHDGSGGASNLVDSGQSWTINEFVGPTIHDGETHDGGNNQASLTDASVTFDSPVSGSTYVRLNSIVHNVTDGSYALVTAVSGSTVTGNLVGGTDNDWDNGDEYEIFIGYNVRNTTDGSISVVYSNNATTAFTFLSGGTDNDWDSSDAYEITDGYPARDQIGRARDNTLSTGTNPVSVAWSSQPLDPAYFWQNKTGGTNFNMQISGGLFVQGHIQEGRDYYDNTVHPTYTALAYPHPLRSASETPSEIIGTTATGNISFGGNIEIR